MAFTQQDKVDFIRSQYADIEKIDFITNNAMFLQAKRKLIYNGFYKVKSESAVSDAAVYNILLIAQNKIPFKFKIKPKRSAT